MDTLTKLQDESLVERLETGIIQIPKELEDAPDEVKSFYIKWIEQGEETRNHPRRYFEFINQKTKELETVDTLGLNGVAVKRAKSKNISESDLNTLIELCKAMEERKTLKSRYKYGWYRWVKPKLGKDIFDWRGSEIIDMFARYLSFDEVETIIKRDWGYDVHSNVVYRFFLKNKDIIDKKRMEFVRTAKEHYLATDAGRMETLSILHTRFLGMFNDIYNNGALTQGQRQELQQLSREIRAIIEQARKEIKGDEVKLTIDGKIDINASLNASATIHEISKKIPINMIPIYLVAAKQGIDPMRIMSSLTSSFYRQFNGYSKLAGKGVVPPNTMDIIRNYDWNEIEQYQRAKETEVVQDIDYEEIGFRDAAVVQTKREKLLKALKEENKKMDES